MDGTNWTTIERQTDRGPDLTGRERSYQPWRAGAPTSAYTVPSPLDPSPPKDRRKACLTPKPFPNIHREPQGCLCTVGHGWAFIPS